MTLTNHALTGAVIGLKIKNPWLAVPLAFASHFLMDRLPHHDYFGGEHDEKRLTGLFNIMLVIDMIVGLTIIYLVGHWFPLQRWLLWGCIAAACVPDLAQGYYYLYLEKIRGREPKFDKLSAWHYSLQNEQPLLGGIIETVWFLVAGAIILSLR